MPFPSSMPRQAETTTKLLGIYLATARIGVGRQGRHMPPFIEQGVKVQAGAGDWLKPSRDSVVGSTVATAYRMDDCQSLEAGTACAAQPPDDGHQS